MCRNEGIYSFLLILLEYGCKNRYNSDGREGAGKKREERKIRYLFWNIYKKNLIGPLIQVILENNIDIIALIETDNLDVQSLINALKVRGHEWKLSEICPMAPIKVLAKQKVIISVHKEEKRYATYKIIDKREMHLLHVVHLSSALYLDENARDIRAIRQSDVLRKIEEDIFGRSEYKSIVAGDFNLQPYSLGITSVHGFNATMSAEKAKKVMREVEGEKKYFYFNPTWKLMGDNKIAQGTYYNSSDQQEKSLYWYSFDELLLRPYFIDKFNWDFFEIIERTQDYEFINGVKINKRSFSDHLPVKFEIVRED